MEKPLKGRVETQTAEGICTLTFEHPHSNCLTGAMCAELAASVEAAGANREARVIVLKSAGEKAFCAGASFDEFANVHTPEEGQRFFMGLAKLFHAMRDSNKMLLCRVQGRTVGGGIGLAAASDYCLAAGAASVRLSELAIGIGPFIIGPVVQRRIGISAFTALALNPTQWRDAQWAREKGLYMDIFPTIGDLDHAVQNLASQLAGYNPEAVAALKKVLWQGTDHWDSLLEERAAMSGKMMLSDFTKRAIEAFRSGQEKAR